MCIMYLPGRNIVTIFDRISGPESNCTPHCIVVL